MDLDPDTFLTTVYVEIDTFCAQHPAPVRRGPHPRMSDSEVLTVMLVGQWHGTSERGTLAWIAQTYHAAFPVLLSPSAFNRRARRLAGLVTTLLHDLAQRLAVWEEWFEIVDGLPVPLAAWTRGKRRKCFPPEEADLGYGGTDKSAYYGISLMLCVTGSGVITGLVTAPANNAERWSLSALLAWRHDPTVVPMGIEAIPSAAKHGRTLVGPVGHRLSPATAGPAVTDVYLADRGFTGDDWDRAWRERYYAQVMTPADLPPTLRHWFHDARQCIETVNGVLTDVLHIRFPRARVDSDHRVRVFSSCHPSIVVQNLARDTTLLLLQVDGDAVHAEPRAVVLAWPIVENVPEMAVAAGAPDFRARHAEGAIFNVFDRARQRFTETRPAAAMIELGGAVEQGVAARGAPVGPFVPDSVVLTGERALGVRLPQHAILLGTQHLAPFVFGFRQRFQSGIGRCLMIAATHRRR